MVLNLFPTGMSNLKGYLRDNYLNYTDPLLALKYNLTVQRAVKRYLDADLEVKKILKSNKMELEDLFQALAIPCIIPCIIEFAQVDNCCREYVSLIKIVELLQIK